MKILHIYKSYYPYSIGGIEKHIHSLTESLNDYGVESAILTTKKGPAHSGLIGSNKVYYFPALLEMASCPISTALLINFRRLAANFDILHYHFPWPFADLSSLLIDKPIIVTYHSDIVRQKWLKIFYRPLMHLFLKRAQVIIASSNDYRQSSPVLKHYAKKITVIPYGLDETKYFPPTTENLQRWRHRVGDNFFLFVGTLRYYKGLHFLLEAVRDTHIRVVIAGSGFEEDKLLRIKAKKNLDNVIFTGHITDQDKAALYQLCRATVAPSHLRAEAFCISLLESLIYGKPAISTQLQTGTSFVNEHLVSGLVVPPADPLAFRQAMQLLLSDEALYQRLKKGTKAHYQHHFSANLMRDKHLDVYNASKRSTF